ncbi:MAG: hypothetical protein KatS3mg080_0995 [Anoxybacillus sp.]|nr:MAG: hypothetical protein KatS3mg080_0995 [Anoxybacillus sp.]
MSGQSGGIKAVKTCGRRGSRKTIIPFVATYIPKDGYIADIGCGDGYGVI